MLFKGAVSLRDCPLEDRTYNSHSGEEWIDCWEGLQCCEVEYGDAYSDVYLAQKGCDNTGWGYRFDKRRAGSPYKKCK